jgi:hypothetical protein
MTGTPPELTALQQAELLVHGIEATGLDVDAELDRLGHMSPVASALLVQEYQLAALAARADKLPA